MADGEEEEVERPAKKKVNAFAMLMGSDSDGDGGGSGGDAQKSSDGEGEAARQEQEQHMQQTAPSKKKKKKKKKKGKGGGGGGGGGSGGNADKGKGAAGGLDEVDLALQEMTEELGEIKTRGNVDDVEAGSVRARKMLLTVERRFLNADAEMKRMFGASAVRGDGGALGGSTKDHRPRVHLRKTTLSTPKPDWPRIGKSGLQMEAVTEGDGADTDNLFRFVHTPEYVQPLVHDRVPRAAGVSASSRVLRDTYPLLSARQGPGWVWWVRVHTWFGCRCRCRYHLGVCCNNTFTKLFLHVRRRYQHVQLKFFKAVQSLDPQNISNILRLNPYHVDSLLQLGEVSCRARATPPNPKGGGAAYHRACTRAVCTAARCWPLPAARVVVPGATAHAPYVGGCAYAPSGALPWWRCGACVHPTAPRRLMDRSPVQVLKIQGDLQTAAGFTERAIYCFESSFHTLFNMATGACRLDYNHFENRAFFLSVFRHTTFVAGRGCWRTAFEYTKFLLSLSPDADPLAAILVRPLAHC